MNAITNIDLMTKVFHEMWVKLVMGDKQLKKYFDEYFRNQEIQKKREDKILNKMIIKANKNIEKARKKRARCGHHDCGGCIQWDWMCEKCQEKCTARCAPKCNCAPKRQEEGMGPEGAAGGFSSPPPKQPEPAAAT
jgi:hypothetical protein